MKRIIENGEEIDVRCPTCRRITSVSEVSKDVYSCNYCKSQENQPYTFSDIYICQHCRGNPKRRKQCVVCNYTGFCENIHHATRDIDNYTHRDYREIS